MEYRIGNTLSFPSLAIVPFALVSSECNTIAAVTLHGINVFELTANVSNREAFQLDRRVIAGPTENNPFQDPGIDRDVINRDIEFHEIHDLFLDRTVSPFRSTDEPVDVAIRQVAWSPLGLLENSGCVLSAVSADHRILLYHRTRWAWQELDQPSKRWAECLSSNQWNETDPTSPVDGHSGIFSIFKSRSYLLGTISIAWSPLCEEGDLKWAWFVTLQRSGHVVIWRAAYPLDRLEFVSFHDLKVSDPSTLKIHRSASGQLLLFIGTHGGLLKMFRFFSDEIAVKMNDTGDVITDGEDGLPVSCIDVASIHQNEIVVVTKNHCLLTFIVKCDGKAVTAVIDHRLAVLPALQITGMTWVEPGLKVMVCTDDYQMHTVDLGIDAGSGQFLESSSKLLQLQKIRIPANPTMLCRGMTAFSPHKDLAFMVLESVKVPHDHLRCRQPSSLTIYVMDNLAKVIGTLKNGDSMQTAAIPLESYKALYGNHWESIWDAQYGHLIAATDYQLQLLRWFSLYKSNVCTEKEAQDQLKLRAEQTAFWLQLRKVRELMKDVLSRPVTLDEDQRLTLLLACEFANVSTVISPDAVDGTDGAIVFDADLVAQVKRRFNIGDQKPKEPCAVCGLDIIFDANGGQCVNKHGATRCLATLRLCFSRTRLCQWCGTHYRREPVFQQLSVCILCGGPTKSV